MLFSVLFSMWCLLLKMLTLYCIFLSLCWRDLEKLRNFGIKTYPIYYDLENTERGTMTIDSGFNVDKKDKYLQVLISLSSHVSNRLVSRDEKQNHNHYTGSGYIKTKSGNMLPCIDILKWKFILRRKTQKWASTR